MSEIKRKKNESFETFMRRVKKRWQQSGKMLQVKKIQFFERPQNKNMRKKSALHRLAVSQKIEYMKKVGLMPEETKGFKK
jgi:ribosomal protein S21